MRKLLFLILLLSLAFGCKSELPFQDPLPDPIAPPPDLGFIPLPRIIHPNPEGDPPTIIYFKALKRTICVGGYVTLKLEIENATYAEIQPLIGEISHFDGENEKRVYDIQENTDFILTLKNENGEASRTVNVFVKDCTEPEPEAEVILVGDPHWTNGGGKKNAWTKVAGNVTNIGDAAAANMEVHIKLYWNDGTLAEEQTTPAGDLAPGISIHWSYKWNMIPEDLWNDKNKDLTSFGVTWF